MSMSKKDFIALADRIKDANSGNTNYGAAMADFTETQIEHLADFCAIQNPRFNRERWLAYIAGECGPNGGAKKGGTR